MTEQEIKKLQFDFYQKHKAGCSFAAIVARNPEDYGWSQVVLDPDIEMFNKTLQEVIKNVNISTISAIFPNIQTINELCQFITKLT